MTPRSRALNSLLDHCFRLPGFVAPLDQSFKLLFLVGSLGLSRSGLRTSAELRAAYEESKGSSLGGKEDAGRL